MKETETPQFKDWTLLQVEGEALVPIVETAVIDPKAVPGKKAPEKPKGKAIVEEILDNRPRTI